MVDPFFGVVYRTVERNPHMCSLLTLSDAKLGVVFLPPNSYPDRAYFMALPRPSEVFYGLKDPNTRVIAVRRIGIGHKKDLDEGYAWFPGVEAPVWIHPSLLATVVPFPEVWK